MTQAPHRAGCNFAWLKGRITRLYRERDIKLALQKPYWNIVLKQITSKIPAVVGFTAVLEEACRCKIIEWVNTNCYNISDLISHCYLFAFPLWCSIRCQFRIYFMKLYRVVKANCWCGALLDVTDPPAKPIQLCIYMCKTIASVKYLLLLYREWARALFPHLLPWAIRDELSPSLSLIAFQRTVLLTSSAVSS